MKLYVFGLLFATSVCFGLSPEERTLLPVGGRSTAETGLESGRYQELTPEEWKAWAKRHAEPESREPSAVSKKRPGTLDRPSRPDDSADSKRETRLQDPDFSDAR